MATNRKFAENNLTQTAVRMVAQTASRTQNGALSGDPVRVGQIPGVALGDADAAGEGVMQLDGVFEHLVGGVNLDASAADANVAVYGGDAIYFNEANTPPLSKRASGGILFGYAVGDHNVQLVASGATTTKCNVRTGR